MATDIETLVVSLEASIKKYERELARAPGVTARRTREVERSIDDMASRIESRLANIGKTLSSALGSGIRGGLAGIAASLGINELVAYGDAWTGIGNRLRGAGIAADDVAGHQQRIVDIALAGRTELQATADLYTKLIGITAQLGFSQDQAATATRAVSQALTLGGVSAGAAAGAITQLGQALGSGVLRGDEFNSVLEALGSQSPLIQAIADEFGVTTGELRGLAEQGQLVADRVFGAILEAAPKIADAFAATTPTVSQAFTDLETAATSLLGVLNNGIGITAALANGFELLAGAATRAARAMAAAGDVEAKNAEFARRMRESAGQESAEDVATRVRRENEAYAAQLALKRNLLGLGPGRNPATPPPAEGGPDEARRAVALSGLPTYYRGALPAPRPPDELGERIGYLYNDADKPGRGGGGRKKSGSARDRADDTLTSLQLELEKTLALGEAKHKIELQEKILAALRRAGVSDTSAEGAAIAGLVTQIDAAKQSMERLKEVQDEVRDIAGDALSTFVSDLRQGKSGAEALADALNRLLDKLLDLAEQALLDSLFGKSGSAGSGLLGSLLGGLIGHNASGTDNWRGGPTWVGERGPEIVNLPRGAQVIPNHRIPVLPSAREMGAAIRAGRSSSLALQQSISIDLSGARGDREIARLAYSMASRAVQENNARIPAMLDDHYARTR